MSENRTDRVRASAREPLPEQVPEQLPEHVRGPDGDAIVLAYPIAANGAIPNNERCPVLAYPGVVPIAGTDPAAAFERLFAANRWGGSWRNGVFAFHHFHSTAHEVLGIYAGAATIALGGEGAVVLDVAAGDVLVVPAGVAHKRLDARDGFACVGAYPRGQDPDMCRGTALTAARLAETVAALGLPERDPVYGENGPLVERWR